MKRVFRLFIFLVFIMGISFVLSKFFEENAEPIQLQLMGWRTKPLATGFLISIVFFSAVLMSFLVTFTAIIAKSIEAGRFRRENLALQKLLEEKASGKSS